MVCCVEGRAERALSDAPAFVPGGGAPRRLSPGAVPPLARIVEGGDCGRRCAAAVAGGPSRPCGGGRRHEFTALPQSPRAAACSPRRWGRWNPLPAPPGHDVTRLQPRAGAL